jgi:hypothetical protein
MLRNNYYCVDCHTTKYLIFPLKDETFIICSGCYYIRKCEEEEKEDK